MSKFKRIKAGDEIKDVIKLAFGIDLDVSGGWGYDAKSAVVVATSSKMPKQQLSQIFATIRATIEMNMTRKEGERYASINPKEVESSNIEIDDSIYKKMTFSISAMEEEIYAKFIQEYKDRHGLDDFNIKGHFHRRDVNTITRKEDYWFLFEE